MSMLSTALQQSQLQSQYILFVLDSDGLLGQDPTIRIVLMGLCILNHDGLLMLMRDYVQL
jgi:hypothetical protein